MQALWDELKQARHENWAVKTKGTVVNQENHLINIDIISGILTA